MAMRGLLVHSSSSAASIRFIFHLSSKGKDRCNIIGFLPMKSAKDVVLILSGKGGVGKSTVACQVAFQLASQGARVGILDVDLCGPSVPTILGVEDREVFKGQNGWIPVACPTGTDSHPIQVMSIAFLLPSSKEAVAWRGPKKDAMIGQFIETVDWGTLDTLIIDTPPGTSDEHLTLCRLLKDYPLSGAVVVTTPQDVSCDDVRKELSLCFQLNIRCLGLIENMSGFTCPHCSQCTHVFSSGGGKALSELYHIPFLGAVPLDPAVCVSEDDGVMVPPHTGAGTALHSICMALQEQLTRLKFSEKQRTE